MGTPGILAPIWGENSPGGKGPPTGVITPQNGGHNFRASGVSKNGGEKTRGAPKGDFFRPGVFFWGATKNPREKFGKKTLSPRGKKKSTFFYFFCMSPPRASIFRGEKDHSVALYYNIIGPQEKPSLMECLPREKQSLLTHRWCGIPQKKYFPRGLPV